MPIDANDEYLGLLGFTRESQKRMSGRQYIAEH